MQSTPRSVSDPLDGVPLSYPLITTVSCVPLTTEAGCVTFVIRQLVRRIGTITVAADMRYRFHCTVMMTLSLCE
jgi:hypothetical protein